MRYVYAFGKNCGLCIGTHMMYQQHGDDSELLILIEYATTDPQSLKVRTTNFAVVVPVLLVFDILP